MSFDFAIESEISHELGKRRAHQRIQKNITQMDLAKKKAGVGIATLQRFEKGERSSLGVFITTAGVRIDIWIIWHLASNGRWLWLIIDGSFFQERIRQKS